VWRNPLVSGEVTPDQLESRSPNYISKRLCQSYRVCLLLPLFSPVISVRPLLRRWIAPHGMAVEAADQRDDD
jgi:hypothetical protein